MCGRVDIHDLRPVKEDMKKYYDWNVEDYIVYDTLGYNIPPSTDLPVWYERDRHGILQPMRWGLIPHWAKEMKTGYSMINARSEEIEKKPAYRDAFRHRRCLIPVNGFYEWKKIPGSKQKEPWYFTARDKPYLLLAGVWDEWKGEDQSIRSCSILTTQANELMKPIHDRMPVILRNEDDIALWLDSQVQEKEALAPIMQPIESDYLQDWRVTSKCNSPAYNDPECIRRVSDTLL